MAVDESFLNLQTKPSKLKYLVDSITVEPILLIFVFTSVVQQQATQNFYLEKTCRVHLAYNASICDALSERKTSGYTEENEAAVQKHVSKLLVVSTFIEGFFPVCLILFLGSWSDRYGRRKPLILAPMIGELIALVLLILNTVFFEEIPVIFTVLSAALPPAITGGWPCLFLGIYSYVSSRTDEENKTAKIGASSTIQNIALIAGLGSIGFALEPLGYRGIYFAAFVLMSSSFIYACWRIKDEEQALQEKKARNELRSSCNFFNFKHFLETFKVCFKNGPLNRKRKMIIIMLANLMVQGAIKGEYSVTYMYTRYKFGWNEVDFSLFFIAHSFIDVFGSFVALVIFSNLFKWEDAALGIIALCTTNMANMMYAFSPNYKYFYAGIILDLFYGTSAIALRSMIAKLVPPHELGQSNSIFGMCEAVVPSIFGPLYSTVYNYTILFFPGTYYFVTLGMYSTGILLFILYRKTNRDKEGKGKIQRNNYQLTAQNDDMDI